MSHLEYLLLPLLKCQIRHINPASFMPGLQSEIRKLSPLSPFEQVPWERSIHYDVLKKQLPLDLEAIVVILVAWRILPLLAEVKGIRDIRIPNRLASVDTVLGFAV